MTFVITSPCLGERFASCTEVCPVDCIYPGDYNQKPFMVIDPDICIDCGACAPECPDEAIFSDIDISDEDESWIERNADESIDADMAEGDSPVLADD